jgi:hypothetical protein
VGTDFPLEWDPLPPIAPTKPRPFKNSNRLRPHFFNSAREAARPHRGICLFVEPIAHTAAECRGYNREASLPTPFPLLLRFAPVDLPGPHIRLPLGLCAIARVFSFSAFQLFPPPPSPVPEDFLPILKKKLDIVTKS